MNQFFDINLAQKSNICLFGIQGCGKTRLATMLSSILNKEGYWVAVFDSVGVWKDISDLPRLRIFDHFYETRNHFQFLKESTIYDISSILLEEQQQFVNEWCREYWNYRHIHGSDKPAIVVFEEAELYARNLKSNTAQQIFRLVMSGRNHPFNTRVMAISPRIANVATEISEQSEQIYAGFTIGENNKRKIRHEFGKEWIEPCGMLETGMFIWRHGKKVEIVKVPLFERESEPELIKPKPLKPRLVFDPPKNINSKRKKKKERGIMGRIFFGQG